MSLQRYAIVDTGTEQVVNCIEYEQAPSYPVPGFEHLTALRAIQHNQASVGWTYEDGVFAPPEN